MITLKDIINKYGELKNKKIVLVRHSLKSDRFILRNHKVKSQHHEDYSNLTEKQKLQSLRMDMRLIEVFTSEKWDDLYQNADVIMVFSSTGQPSAEFLGAFYLHGTMTENEWFTHYEDYLSDAPEFLQKHNPHIKKYVRQLGYSATPACGGFFYKIRPVDGDINNDLMRRLIIEWLNPVKWVQRDLNKAVLEIRPPGFVREWNGYYDFTLSFRELRELVKFESGNPDWKNYLSCVSGVYVILDPVTGRLYVGSAYGKGGIWSRWRGYALTLHNNNLELVRHFAKDPESFDQFQISVLKIMDKSAGRVDVIREESLIKEKLGSRTFGFNAN